MDFIVGLPESNGCDSLLVAVDRLSKMAHFIPTRSDVNSEQVATIFFNNIFRFHGLPDSIVTGPPPEDTMLFQSDQGVMPAHYRRGIIGRRDRTMEPMILAGSIVLIDTRKRAIAKRKDWVNEFDRPIYFLLTRNASFCGFCELDKNEEYLKLVPHALSPQTEDDEQRRWQYRKQVEVVGTVDAVFARRIA